MKSSINVALRGRLRARQKVLETAIEILQRDDADAAGHATIQSESSTMLDAIGNEIAGELLLLSATLGRLDDGSYGRCADCGSDISESRLQRFMYAQLCEPCAERAGGEAGEADSANPIDEKIDELQRTLRSA